MPHPEEKMPPIGPTILQAGEILGERYKIIQALSSGGFAVTYIAEDIEALLQATQAKCVVKQLQPQINSPRIWEKAKERFATEAIMLARLGNHDRIPSLLAYLEENQQLYLIQEFIEGEELEEEIQHQILSEIQVITFLQDVLETLDFVHQQGVIHRDIKPSNLIRRQQDGKIVLIDFGAVKEISTLLLDPDSQTRYTQIIGTPGYMSPEQERGKPVFSSDIYALGKTAMYALTGQQPQELDDTLGESNNWQKFVPVANQPISPKLAAILNKMSCSKASDRYHSVAEVLADLQPLLLIGQTIGNSYEITSYLGGGSWGNTYLAKNYRRSYQSPCVIKQLKPHRSNASHLLQAQRRFLSELKVLDRLASHPQIPELWDHFEENGHFYLVQEFIEGQNFSQELKIYKRLSEPAVVELLKDVLQILDFIHQQGVIHRDIKPSNLIRRQQDDRIVLIDFGAVKKIFHFAEENDTLSSTQPIGTEGYIPPEQITGRPIFSSDIYALGMTAIQALTGIHPTQLPTNPQTGAIVWQEEVIVTPELAHILERMIHLDLKKRYSQAKEVLKDLQKRKKSQGQKLNLLSLFAHWYGYMLGLSGIFFLMLLTIYVNRINQASFFFQQGDLKQESQEYDIAVKYYEQGLETVPPLANLLLNLERAWLQKAAALSSLKDYQAMLGACEGAIASHHQSVFGRICKGTALQKLGQNPQAIDAYEEAKEIEPNNFEVWHNLGQVYGDMGQKQLALEHFQQAIKVGKEKSYVTWNDLGKLYYQFREYQLALSAYQQAVQVKPNYIPAWIGLGNVQNYLREYGDALKSYQEALKIKELNHEAWYGQGLAYEGLKQYRQALESYERAIFINPKYQAALQARIRVKSKIRP
jgi:serine/threonine protein kinase/cytochrome c-type biogenesis protein CcmH/NrfG